jgi:hypothetical protein
VVDPSEMTDAKLAANAMLPTNNVLRRDLAAARTFPIHFEGMAGSQVHPGNHASTRMRIMGELSPNSCSTIEQGAGTAPPVSNDGLLA